MIDIKNGPNYLAVEEWAKTQKRITNGRIRKEFSEFHLTEEQADTIYDQLKANGIVGSMGYVVHE